MEGQENTDAPVLNTDEAANPGDSLVENSGGGAPEEAAPVVENNEQNSTNEDPDAVEAFDADAAAAFASAEPSEKPAEEGGEGAEEKPTEEESLGSWDDFATEEKPTEEKPTEEKPTEEKPVENSEAPATELTNDQFKAFADQLGLKAETMDEVKAVLDDLVSENAKLKEQGAEPISNKRIEDLNNFLKLDDEALVKRSLEADGLEGDKLEYAVDRLMDSGLIDIEAIKIRNNVEKAIKAETNNEIKAKEAEVAKQHEEHDAAVNKFNDFMQSTDSLGGFKLTGNPDKLPDVRKAHTEYVTSGEYLNEITASEQALAESSWLWRNRETLKNALINNGRQNGRKEILDQIGRPDSSKPQRFTAPDKPGEFNPKKFMAKSS